VFTRWIVYGFRNISDAPELFLIIFFLWTSTLVNICFDYLLFVGFVLDHVIVPASKFQLEMQHNSTFKLIKAYMPTVNPLGSLMMMSTRRLRKCSVVVLHAKPYDVLPGLVNAREGAAFLELIQKLLDECFAESGLIRVFRFGGVFAAVACDQLDVIRSDISNTHMGHRVRAVSCIRHIQRRLEKFNATYKVNSALGVCVCDGTVIMGATSNRFSFDLLGVPAIMACTLAVKQPDNAILTEELYKAVDRALPTVGNRKKFYTQPPGCSLPVKVTTVVLLEGSFGGQGRQLKDFKYCFMLGKGGYGSVHLVTDSYDIKYAVKLIPKKKSSTADIMISREFQILTQMKHPNVTILKYCIVDALRVYLVMEYVRGGNLKQIIDKYKPAVKDLILWFAELVNAIEYVHNLGIIHRDVKPVNCMIQWDGHLKLGDFGLAKHVGSDTVRNGATLSDSAMLNGSDQGSASMAATRDAISLMQKVLPIRHVRANDDSAQMIGLIQALVVDENKERIRETCESLRKMMVEPYIAHTEDEVSRLLEDPHMAVDLIMLNVNIDENGSDWKLMKDLRTKSAFESIPLLVLSEFDDAIIEQRAVEYGAKEFIIYPLLPEKHRLVTDILA
jgi:CheY-like chemotaxis protein